MAIAMETDHQDEFDLEVCGPFCSGTRVEQLDNSTKHHT